MTWRTMLASTAKTCTSNYKHETSMGYNSVSQAYNYSQHRPEYPKRMIQILNTCAYRMWIHLVYILINSHTLCLTLYIPI